MTDSPTTYMTAKEAAMLADELLQCGGKLSVTARVATMERSAARRLGSSGQCCGRCIQATYGSYRRRNDGAWLAHSPPTHAKSP